MESLPNEMLQLIMGYLTLPKDMLRFALASKQIYAASDYDLFCRLQAMLPIHRYISNSLYYIFDSAEPSIPNKSSCIIFIDKFIRYYQGAYEFTTHSDKNNKIDRNVITTFKDGRHVSTTLYPMIYPMVIYLVGISAQICKAYLHHNERRDQIQVCCCQVNVNSIYILSSM